MKMINYLIDGTLLACPSENASANKIKKYFDTLDCLYKITKEHHNISVWFSEKTKEFLWSNDCYPTQNRLTRLCYMAERPLDKYSGLFRSWFNIDGDRYNPLFEKQFWIPRYFYYNKIPRLIPEVEINMDTTSLNMLLHINSLFEINDINYLIVKGNIDCDIFARNRNLESKLISKGESV